MKTNLENQKFRLIVFLAASVAAFSIGGIAQTDTVNVPDSFEGGEGTLNNAITAAINDGTLSNKVFKLKPYGLYILTGTITVPAGKRLTIVAPEPGTTQLTAPPQIRWSDTASWACYSFQCFGDVTFKNIWLLYADMAGNQRGTSVQIADSPDSINGQRGDFEGVIFDYAPISGYGSGSVEVTARHFRGRFENCYFRNNIDQHFRYYGRAVSFPFNSTGWHIDTLRFVNCTFANIGYVIMQEGGEYADYVFMNHCTFLNTVMYTLESGWWYWLSVTNTIFVKAFMYRYYPIHTSWSGQPPGGTICIDSVARFGFTPPFTDAQRHILFRNSSYAIQNWLRQHMANAEPIWDPDSMAPIEARKPHPQPMMNQRTFAFFDTVINGTKVWPYINRANLYDSTDPGFVVPATNEFAIKRFLTKKWTNSEDTNWAFMPEASLNQVWPLPERLRVTNNTLRTAGSRWATCITGIRRSMLRGMLRKQPRMIKFSFGYETALQMSRRRWRSQRPLHSNRTIRIHLTRQLLFDMPSPLSPLSLRERGWG